MGKEKQWTAGVTCSHQACVMRADSDALSNHSSGMGWDSRVGGTLAKTVVCDGCELSSFDSHLFYGFHRHTDIEIDGTKSSA